MKNKEYKWINKLLFKNWKFYYCGSLWLYLISDFSNAFSYDSSMEISGFCINKSKSPSRSSGAGVTGSKLRTLMQNPLYFTGNKACYPGNRHRYRGYHGLNGNNEWNQDGGIQDGGPPVAMVTGGGAQHYTITERWLEPRSGGMGGCSL